MIIQTIMLCDVIQNKHTGGAETFCNLFLHCNCRGCKRAWQEDTVVYIIAFSTTSVLTQSSFGSGISYLPPRNEKTATPPLITEQVKSTRLDSYGGICGFATSVSYLLKIVKVADMIVLIYMIHSRRIKRTCLPPRSYCTAISSFGPTSDLRNAQGISPTRQMSRIETRNRQGTGK